MRPARPGPLVIAAFAFVVVVGGSNFVAVRISNRELPPFFGAGFRFVLATLLLMCVTAVTRGPLPRGRALRGAVVFGFLNFFAAYAFFYWGLEEVSAAFAGVLFGTIPLFTLVLAVLQGQERFRWRALLGAALAVVGVVVMIGDPADGSISFVHVLAILAAILCAAEAAIVVKHYPSTHPIAFNTVAMGVGAVLLVATSVVAREPWALPERAGTWAALAFLVPLGSVGLFIAYVYVVQKWTASGASYQFVLYPIVTAVTGALVVDEPLNAAIAIGGALAIAGTYVGAFTGPRADVAPAEPVG
jgi:drug/metabolite transporter (DMT)-like permease